MNFTLSSTGTRADVLAYLQSISGPPERPQEAQAVSPVSTEDPSQKTSQDHTLERERVAVGKIVAGLSEYIRGAPEGADAFTVQANIYIGWESP